MKHLLLAVVFSMLTSLAVAAPSSLKEALAVEGQWKVEPPSNEFSFKKPKLTSESARALLSRVASARSDAERKTAAFIAKANFAQLETLVLAPAAKIDAANTRALRSVLEKMAASTSVAQSDAAELKRILELAR